MYRRGAAMVQNDFNSRAPTELEAYDLDEAWSLEANNDFFVEMAPRWSLQWATVARYEDTGHPGFDENGTGESILWLSTGIRPMFYIKPKFNLAWESGIDYIDNQRIGAKGVSRNGAWRPASSGRGSRPPSTRGGRALSIRVRRPRARDPIRRARSSRPFANKSIHGRWLSHPISESSNENRRPSSCTARKRLIGPQNGDALAGLCTGKVKIHPRRVPCSESDVAEYRDMLRSFATVFGRDRQRPNARRS